MDEYPKLRSLNLRWAQVEGNQFLVLQDPLRLTEHVLMVPGPLASFLGLLDGTRDLGTLVSGFALRTGVTLPPETIDSPIQTLDEALLLENQRFFDAKQAALVSYQSGPFRVPALAGGGYPDDPTELKQALDEHCENAGPPGFDGIDENVPSVRVASERVVGVISPHIDYARGWRTYAHIWQSARKAVEEADLVILLGTDHGGGSGRLTLTRQSYATPWGILPTDIGLVDSLADILGEEGAFAEEAHHMGEHSIELAAVWLHYMASGKPKRLLPILCGYHLDALASVSEAATTGEGTNGDNRPFWDALAMLGDVAARPCVLVVAAGDVSHVGPAFGDTSPFDAAANAQVRSSDKQWLEIACSGESDLLTEHILNTGDPTRICGTAPIHHMVRMLGGATGRVRHYDQCPADEDFGSLVSIAGAQFTA